MAIYPGASVRLIDRSHLVGNGLAMAAYNRVNLHVAGGNGSLFGYFNQEGKPSSHFWVAKSGLVEQYVDTALRAEADLQGNDATVSIETEGKGEAWTPEQQNAIIALVFWILTTHSIPLRLADDSQIGPSSRGISWHRLGINGNFPALPSRYAGRQQRGGGMLYSSATGKVCPVEPNIDLIFDAIYPGVVSLAAGGGGFTPPPVPVPPTPTPPPAPSGIAVDGFWGSGTTRSAQQVLGTAVDGEIWYQYAPNKQAAFTTGWVWNYAKGKGSPLVAAMQRGLGVGADGVWGKNTTIAFQNRMGTVADGVLWEKSPAVMEFQRRLNAGTW